MIVARSRTRLDDSLDVFAGHGSAALLGTAHRRVRLQGVERRRDDGLLAGNPVLYWRSRPSASAPRSYSAVATFALLKVLGFVTALRAAPKTEGTGMDVTQHGEGVHQR